MNFSLKHSAIYILCGTSFVSSIFSENLRYINTNFDLVVDETKAQKSSEFFFNPSRVFENEAIIKFANDSNVNQLPDGETSVTGKKGSSHATGISLKYYKKLDKKKEPFTYSIDLGQTEYSKKAFSTLESKNLNFGISKKFKKPKTSKFLSVTSTTNYRIDYLKAFGKFQKGFSSFTSSLMLIQKPKKIQNHFMDLIIPIYSASLDYKDFVKNYGTDSNGSSKDTYSPSFSTIVLTTKKYASFKNKSLFIFNLKNNFSSSKNQKYLNLRLSYAWTAILGQSEISPDISYNYRNQDDYQSSARKDKKFSIGASYKYKFKNKKTNFKAKVQFSDQKSNLSSFSYKNTQFSISSNHKF